MNTPGENLTANNPFYTIDFDRTLADSDKLLDVFLDVADHYFAIPREQIDAAHEDVKARGDSFDTAGYVRDELSELGEIDKWEKLEKQFIHESRSLNMLLPGASELLAELASRHLRFGILTYGNPLWQHLKLSAAGFNHVPRIVLEHKYKGRLISSWQQPDGLFELPQEFGGGVSDSIIMLDDKAVSFDEFPAAPSLGYWVVNKEFILPSQEGSVPANVTHVVDLGSVKNILFSD